MDNKYLSSNKLAKNIREAREKLGLPIDLAAERCGLSEERLMQMEAGKNTNASAIDVLRVAEGYGVSYQSLFAAKGGAEILNAFVPVDVYKGIGKILKQRSILVKDFCEMVGCNPSAFYYWRAGNNNSSPMMFENMISLLQLKASDLEKMVVAEPVAKPEKEEVPLPEPKPELVCEEPEKEESKQADPFEERMLKIMRLQKNMDDVLDKLKLITVTAYELHNQLEELKGA